MDKIHKKCYNINIKILGGKGIMILNKNHIDAYISEEEQQREILRVKEARNGEVLFTAAPHRNHDQDIIETLLHMAKVQYTIGVDIDRVEYVKKED